MADATLICWPTIARSTSSSPWAAPAARMPGRSATRGGQGEIASQLGVDRHGVGVQVEQATDDRDGTAEVPRIGERARQAQGGRVGRRHVDRAGRPGSRSVRAYVCSSTTSTPRMAWPEPVEQARVVERLAIGEQGASRAPVACRPRRSSDGATA